MRLAWFHPSPRTAIDDRTGAVAAEVSRTHDVTHFDAAIAHTFVPSHRHAPFDLCVYELGADACAFAVPYALHFPGVVALHDTWLPDTRIRTSLLVTGDAGTAARLASVYDARVRIAPAGIDAPMLTLPATATPNRQVRVAATTRPDVLDRAAARASAAGARITISPDPHAADIVVALDWPPTGAVPHDALRAFAARRTVVILETEATAGWPALDPQTWQPRGMDDPATPVAVALDPRDEEHSLMLALRRLSMDAALRRQLADAGHAWWQTHHTLVHARDAWLRILDEAAGMTFTPAADLLDGTQTARAILADMGVRVDFL